MRTLNANRAYSVRFRQQENASLVYGIEWGGASTSAISVSAWSSDSATVSGGANTDHATSITVAGSVGTHMVTNKVTFADGSVDERSFAVEVRDQYAQLGAMRDYG